MRTNVSIILISCLMCSTGFSQEVYQIWAGREKPFYKENNLKEYEAEAFGTKVLYNVTEPTITIYPSKGENSHKAVIILPGGGYQLEAIYHEGYEVAALLAENGITAIVLKYRLPDPRSSDQPYLVPLTDTRRALQLIREKADEYGIDKSKIGVLGFSAGSHLATCACLWKSDIPDENPDFAGLIYGVTNHKPDNIKWIEESLYHRKLTNKEIEQNNFLSLVSTDTPPTFLVHAYDDDVCHVSESTLYAEKLFENGVMAEMHLFPSGGHGFGLGRNSGGTEQWPLLFVNWVKKSF